MAVLIEAISVVVRRIAIETNYRGGWDQFVNNCPNRTLCADQYIARIGFMTPSDAELFVQHLLDHGLMFMEHGAAVDIATIGQLTGPLVRVDWLETGRVSVTGGEVTACRLHGDATTTLVTPDDWRFDESLSDRTTFVPADDVADRMEFVRHNNGCDVFRD